MAKTMFDYINSSTELIEENLKKRIALFEDPDATIVIL